MRAAAAVLVVASGAQGHATCRLSGEQLGPANESSLKREPRTLLLQYPQGGEGLRGATLQMAAAGPGTLDAVSSIVSLATNPQRQAIGAGLAGAVNACSKQDSDLSKRITLAAKGSGSAALLRAYNLTLDTSVLDGASGPATSTAAAATNGLAPTIGSGLALPKSRTLPGLSDPYGDPAGWH